MTTSRIIRGTRTKIFFYICAILIIVGIIACYNNTLSQLDDVRKSYDLCHQEGENLSTQLQVITDYKLRLEKSLKTEQADNQQIKTNLENQLKEERNKYEKDASAMNTKLGSLQQHFNLLQTQYDDYKEDSGKTNKQQEEKINNLEARISELLDEQKNIKSSKDSLKAQYDELQHEKQQLEEQLREHQNKNENGLVVDQLKRENEDLKTKIKHLKEKCPGGGEVLSEPALPENPPKNANSAMRPPEILPKPNDDDKQQELNVLPQPNAVPKPASSSSTTAANKAPKPSQGDMAGARPIFLPTVTPETAPKEKLPDGVVAVPQKKEEEEVVNARYQNARDSAQNDQLEGRKAKNAQDDNERENVAHEILDPPLFPDGLQFGDNDQVKQVDKPNLDKKHIDTLGNQGDQDAAEYKEMQNDVQLEENDDDDGDGYDDHLARQKEPAVRN